MNMIPTFSDKESAYLYGLGLAVMELSKPTEGKYLIDANQKKDFIKFIHEKALEVINNKK